MRYFIALEIPDKNRSHFQAIQAKLHILIPQARLTDVDKIHLTLAFIGEQKDELQSRLTQIIQAATSGVASFEVTPAYIDGFPNIHKPQVLWIGVKGDIDKILLIRERVKDGLTLLNLAMDERRFIPHITIAKLNNHYSVTSSLETQLQQITSALFEPIKIISIKLFESIPSGGFHKHNTLAEVKLTGSG